MRQILSVLLALLLAIAPACMALAEAIEPDEVFDALDGITEPATVLDDAAETDTVGGMTQPKPTDAVVFESETLPQDAAASTEPAPEATADADTQPDDAVVTDTDTVYDGTIRVLLTYPGRELTETDILLDGSYSVNGNAGFRFGRGSRLHLFVADNEAVLTYQGMTLHTGAGFELTRHVTDGNNGLYIGDVEGLYEGDLAVSVVDGCLRMVLSIYIEDYLRGVVPYEMSDSWPIEALKAQAVAARTYALRRKNTTRDFDVYDNTNDQVFRGSNAAYANAAEAVSATEGIVGTYKGELSECFYSASNGGQTDLVENELNREGDFGYLDMRNDPYDLNNPNSLVKTASLPKQPTSDFNIPDGMQALIAAALAPRLEAEGYLTAPEAIYVADISDVSIDTPRFPEPSRVYTKLHMALRIMASPASSTASTVGAQPFMVLLGDTYDVTLDIFGDGVEAALGLSINRSDNELMTVREENDRYVIESRRFGHGVGLSQRGAENMAGQHKWKYQTILKFYYPGMIFEKRKYAPSILPLIINETPATPLPTAEPTPRPTYIPTGDVGADAVLAEVALSNDSSTLNLRAEMSTTSQILYALMNGQTVVVLQDMGNGWVHISVGPYSGYVAAQYLRLK